jgi:DNA invertase Pin-like site-specific DNA recombinase
MATGAFVAYYRVSTAKQGKSGLGLEAQRAAVEHYLDGGKWRITAEFTEVESGRRSDRPQLEAALKAARARRCPLVVANVSRLTRSVAFLTRLLEAGVDVRFADLPQIEGPTGRFMLTQMAAVAELEAGFIGDRTKKALASAKAAGRKLGGRRRILLSADGEKKRYGDYVSLSNEARVLGTEARKRRAAERARDLAPVIEELRASGLTTLREMAAALTERGIPTARGATEWGATQVSRVMALLDDSPPKAGR